MLRVRLLVVFVTLAAALPGAAQPAAAPPANDDCQFCHADAGATRANGTSVAVAPEAFGASVHGAFACVDCHQDLATVELPHAERLARVACDTCHDDAVKAFASSVHAAVGAEGPTCASCHGVHDIRPSSDTASRTYALNLPATCAACHGGDHLAGGPGRVADGYIDSVHGRGLAKSGLVVSANCASCHSAHDVRRKTDPASKVHRTQIAATCTTCHQGLLAVFEGSVHGAGMANGNTAAAVCSDCHTSHWIQRSETEAWKLAVIDECGTCHVEKIATYRDTYHGQVTDLGFTRIAACKDCHGSHDILPASNPASRIAPANVADTCRTCHAGVPDNFALYDPHADKNDPERSPALYWTARFMYALLGGVFVVFGAHTLAWFPRSLQARREKRARQGGGR
ncbi:MAG: hypothetical protein AB1635_15645 [Acidobacteriota bacterium]